MGAAGTALRSCCRRMVAALVAMLIAAPAAAEPPGPERRQEVLHLLRHDCGSCHGMRLKGGLGPALTPESLGRLPTDAIVRTILRGRPGTAMPPWDRFLSEREARWLAERLLSGDLDPGR